MSAMLDKTAQLNKNAFIYDPSQNTKTEFQNICKKYWQGSASDAKQNRAAGWECVGNNLPQKSKVGFKERLTDNPDKIEPSLLAITTQLDINE